MVDPDPGQSRRIRVPKTASRLIKRRVRTLRIVPKPPAVLRHVEVATHKHGRARQLSHSSRHPLQLRNAPRGMPARFSDLSVTQKPERPTRRVQVRRRRPRHPALPASRTVTSSSRVRQSAGTVSSGDKGLPPIRRETGWPRSPSDTIPASRTPEARRCRRLPESRSGQPDLARSTGSRPRRRSPDRPG